jgi:hypothetical protein
MRFALKSSLHIKMLCPFSCQIDSFLGVLTGMTVDVGCIGWKTSSNQSLLLKNGGEGHTIIEINVGECFVTSIFKLCSERYRCRFLITLNLRG